MDSFKVETFRVGDLAMLVRIGRDIQYRQYLGHIFTIKSGLYVHPPYSKPAHDVEPNITGSVGWTAIAPECLMKINPPGDMKSDSETRELQRER